MSSKGKGKEIRFELRLEIIIQRNSVGFSGSRAGPSEGDDQVFTKLNSPVENLPLAAPSSSGDEL